jgi:hypothetical protein
MPRKTITDMIPDIEAPAEVPGAPPDPPVPAEPERAAPAGRKAGTPPESQRQRAPRSRAATAARPSARDLAAPARPSIAREALKADVPADLALLHRLRRYRLDTGTDIRDQVAIAVDEWLTSQGY